MKRITIGEIERVLNKRIDEAFYTNGFLPSERDLSAELGVARSTVRKALLSLVGQGVLERNDNGRLLTARRADRADTSIGLFFPSINSCDYANTILTFCRAAQTLPIQIRPIFYWNWHDATLSENFERVDAIILLARPQIPLWMIRKLCNSGKPVLSLQEDLSEYGIPSFDLFPPKGVRHFLEYLTQCGHRDIDYLSVAPLQMSRNRREVWRAHLERTGGTGTEYDFSLPDVGLSIEDAYDVIHKKFNDGVFHLDRLLLASMIPTIAFTRVAADAGLTAGKDYSIALLDGETQSEFFVPRYTSAERCDPIRQFRRYLHWMRQGGPWDGPLRWEADDIRILPGESIIRKTQENPAPAPAE